MGLTRRQLLAGAGSGCDRERNRRASSVPGNGPKVRTSPAGLPLLPGPDQDRLRRARARAAQPRPGWLRPFGTARRPRGSGAGAGRHDAVGGSHYRRGAGRPDHHDGVHVAGRPDYAQCAGDLRRNGRAAVPHRRVEVRRRPNRRRGWRKCRGTFWDWHRWRGRSIWGWRFPMSPGKISAPPRGT